MTPSLQTRSSVSSNEASVGASNFRGVEPSLRTIRNLLAIRDAVLEDRLPNGPSADRVTEELARQRDTLLGHPEWLPNGGADFGRLFERVLYADDRAYRCFLSLEGLQIYASSRDQGQTEVHRLTEMVANAPIDPQLLRFEVYAALHGGLEDYSHPEIRGKLHQARYLVLQGVPLERALRQARCDDVVTQDFLNELSLRGAGQDDERFADFVFSRGFALEHQRDFSSAATLYQMIGLDARFAGRAREKLAGLPNSAWISSHVSGFTEPQNILLNVATLGTSSFFGSLAERSMARFLETRLASSVARRAIGTVTRVATESAVLPALQLGSQAISQGSTEGVSWRNYRAQVASTAWTLGFFRGIHAGMAIAGNLLARVPRFRLSGTEAAMGMPALKPGIQVAHSVANYGATIAGFATLDWLHDPQGDHPLLLRGLIAAVEDAQLRFGAGTANILSRGRIHRFEAETQESYQRTDAELRTIGNAGNRFLDRLAAGAYRLCPQLLWMAMGAVAPPAGRTRQAAEFNPSELLTHIDLEIRRIRDRFNEKAGELESEVRQGYEAEFGRLEQRLEYWLKEIMVAEESTGESREHHLQDIQIGQHLLLDRTLRFAATIFSEPMSANDLAAWGLRQRFRIRPPRVAGSSEGPAPDKPARPTASEGSRTLAALVNRDIGYGRELSLRFHQAEALRAIQGWIASQAGRVHQGSQVGSDYLHATVVMPVGGGKTRVMVASFAAALEQGVFLASRGDRLILLNHSDQIHRQNLEVLQRVNPYFRRNTGRDLRISEYKAENKDLSGDVVVVSVPTVNSAERRTAFAEQLQSALGTSGRISMVAIDEVHHLELSRQMGRESWPELLATLREVSPNFFQLGFTATPTGREGRVLYQVHQRELMRAGVTPRTYLVRVEGEDLTQLKVGQRSEDFVVSELSSTLLNHPERNQRLYQALERQGMRRNEPSPSGRERFEPALGFAADLRHAAMLARDYVAYFGAGEGIRGRRLSVLGKEGGRISARDLENALQAYRRGESDGVVAIISGQSGAQRDPVLQAVERGEIEAVFTVNALVEGADLHMFRQQLGARPTFSRILRGQERGRINRRGPDEVSAQGELLQDPPRILFDVVDRYRGDRSLVPYGLIMGVRHLTAQIGELFDAMTSEVSESLDLSGHRVSRLNPEELLEGRNRPLAPNSPATEASPFQPLMEALGELLAGQYAGRMEEMALDLGEPVEFIEGLTEGRGWENNQWFMRRLANLLYLNRETFLDRFTQALDSRGGRVSLEDIEALRAGLRLYERWEGNVSQENRQIGGVEISAHTLSRLSRGNVGEQIWRDTWRALGNYFWDKIGEGPEEISNTARDQFLNLYHQLGRHLGWTEHREGGKDRLLQMARFYAALRFGGVLPSTAGIEGVREQNVNTTLSRWLAGGADYSTNKNPQSFYQQIRSLLIGMGANAQETAFWIEDSVFSEREWNRVANSPHERLLLEARLRVAARFGGQLPPNAGIEGISPQHANAALTRWLANESEEGSAPFNRQSLYSQVRNLLVGVGADPRETHSWIEDTVFFEQGWSREAQGPQERLLLEARRGVAERFGGILPRRTGIDGLPIQSADSLLTQWLDGEPVDYSPQSLYSQVRALLIGLGEDPRQIDSWIEAAVFADRGWSQTAGNAQERLLLETRRRVAGRFGGVLPADTGIAGLPKQTREAFLARWLSGERVEYSRSASPQIFYFQVRALLTGMGEDPQQVVSWIEAAVFAERGWNPTADNPRDRLLLEARRRVAERFGGLLPRDSGLDVPAQNTHSPLSRWLDGQPLEFSIHYPAQHFYSQVRALLVALGASTKEIDPWIEASVFTERGWNPTASNSQERLRLEMRRRIAIRFGGVLPSDPGIAGVARQNAEAFLTRWLEGASVEHSRAVSRQAFYSQVRCLLAGLGVDVAEGDRLVEDAIFSEHGWNQSATNPQERLLLEARRRVARRFGGVLPSDPDIETLPRQDKYAPLTRWLAGETIYWNHLMSQVRALLSDQGYMPPEEIDRLISEATASQ